ncbi:MAG: iron chaperone [Sphaerochaetaceae bacterium]
MKDDAKPNISTIDAYIEQCDPSLQPALVEMYSIIRDAVPEATEKISYGMPAFFLKKNLVYFAASRNHIGFYPTSSGVEAFKDELGPYKWSKGTIQFPWDKPLPVELIRKIVRFRVKEVLGG